MYPNLFQRLSFVLLLRQQDYRDAVCRNSSDEPYHHTTFRSPVGTAVVCSAGNLPYRVVGCPRWWADIARLPPFFRFDNKLKEGYTPCRYRSNAVHDPATLRRRSCVKTGGYARDDDDALGWLSHPPFFPYISSVSNNVYVHAFLLYSVLTAGQSYRFVRWGSCRFSPIHK